MGSILTIFKREVAAYFNVAIAYIFIIVFVLLNGGLYMTQFFLLGAADMRPFFTTLPFLLAVFIPAVTMRQWSEEKRGNTLELLLTFPTPTYVLVVGKFLASLLFYVVALAGTFSIPIMLSVLGKPDVGVMISGYIGTFFLGAFFLAAGIFISGLCRDQIVAFILSMLICFGLHLLGTEFFAMSIDGWVPGFGSFLRQFVGSATHFDAFAKGIIDSRDVLYFVIGIVIFLALNAFWLDARMRSGAKKIFVAATLISVGIFFMTNWLFSSISLGRFDLTEAKTHTISEATKTILRDLKAPVMAKLYISPVEKMPTGMKTLEQDIVDKLDELRIHSGGNLQYKIIHMEAANVVDPKEAGEAESMETQLGRKGIQPFQVQAVESDEVAVRLVYASLGLSYKEKAEEIVPQIVPANLYDLEYTIASKVYRMTLDESPKIALVAPYQEQQIEPEVAALLKQLGGGIPDGYKEDHYELLELSLNYEGYETSRIILSEEEPLDSGTDTLVIVEPKEFTPRQKYEINRFLVSGGSVFMSVQNYEYNYAPQGRDLQILPVDKRPQVNDLLEGWGFEVDRRILVDEQHDMINLSGGMKVGPFSMNLPVKIPIQILINANGMNQDVSVTSRLSPIFYLWGTALKLNDARIDEQKLKVTELLRSSENSWDVPFRAGSLKPDNLMKASDSAAGPFSLAVLAQGQFKDLYAGKPVPPWSEPAEDDPEGASLEPEEAEPIEAAPGKLILVGASSFLQKHLVSGGGNLSFFMNAIDVITLGDELVTIRSKRPINRAVGRISTAKKVFWRFVVTLLIPILIAVIGTLRVFWRRKSKQDYLNAYSNES